MKHLYKVPLLLLFTFLLAATTARATERYALDEGLNCNACHYNPSGAGALNIQGRYYQRNQYSLKDFPDYLASLKKIIKERKEGKEETDAPSGILSAALERLSLQGVIRTLFKQTADRQPSVTKDNFDLLDATLTLGMKVHDRLHIIYATELNDLHASDAFMTGMGASGLFLQIGQFTTPFGLNSDDPTIMVRNLYGLQYFLKDIGLTLGYEKKNGIFLNGSILNGYRHFSASFGGTNTIGDPFRGLALTGNFGIHLKQFIIGLSGLVEMAGKIADSHVDTELLTAAYLSTTYKRLHLSAEADLGVKKGIGTGTRAGLAPDGSPQPVKNASADFVEPFNGKISPDFGNRSFGSFIKLTYDLIPKKWDASAQYDMLTGNISYFGDAPIRVTLATKYWPLKNFSIEPQLKFNRTPGGQAKNAPSTQLDNAKRRNQHEILIYAKASF